MKKTVIIIIIIFCILSFLYFIQKKRIYNAENMRIDRCKYECQERGDSNCFCNRIFTPSFDEVLFYKNGNI